MNRSDRARKKTAVTSLLVTGRCPALAGLALAFMPGARPAQTPGCQAACGLGPLEATLRQRHTGEFRPGLLT